MGAKSRTALDANGAPVEAAYSSAKEARSRSMMPIRRAKALPERIRLVSSIAVSVGDLLRKAGNAV